jgi:hypothetical protein
LSRLNGKQDLDTRLTQDNAVVKFDQERESRLLERFIVLADPPQLLCWPDLALWQLWPVINLVYAIEPTSFDVLGSRTVADDLTQRFSPTQVCRPRKINATRKRLESLTGIPAGKDRVISVAVEDRDSQSAADLANAFVDEQVKTHAESGRDRSRQAARVF